MIKKWLLRGLCILGLTLLPISFSNANVYTGSIPGVIYNTEYNNYPHDYFIDKYLNFYTDNTYNNLFYTYGGVSNPTGPRSWILFWNNRKIAGYGNIQTSSTQKIIAQGYYSSYCNSNINDFESFCNPDMSNGFGGNYTTDIQRFYNIGAIYDEYYFNTNSVATPFLCFISTQKHIVSCFMINISNNDGVYGNLNQYLSGVDILSGVASNPSFFDDLYFGYSPFEAGGYGGVGSGGGTIVGGEANGITNKVVINGYENIGFSSYLCYGGVLRNDYSAFIPGTGSTIFQLYDQYGSGFRALGHWYNYYRQGYIQYPAINNSGSVFIIDGVFKMPLYGLFYLGSYYGGSSLKTSDIINYCDLLLNHNNNYIYTGSQDISGILQGAIQDNIINNNYWYSGNQQIYPTGAIAHLSGENLNWDGRSFFEKLTDKFANAFPAPSGDYSGFIPGYILLFMFALIFIRILHK